MGRLREKYRKDSDGRDVLQTYIAEFYDRNRHPKLKRVSLCTRDRRAANQAFAELERKYMAGLWDPWTDTIHQDGLLVSEATARFQKSREGLKTKTLAMYSHILRLFKERLPPGMMLQAVEERHVHAFLSGQRLNATSRRTYVRQCFLPLVQAEGLPAR